MYILSAHSLYATTPLVAMICYIPGIMYMRDIICRALYQRKRKVRKFALVGITSAVIHQRETGGDVQEKGTDPRRQETTLD